MSSTYFLFDMQQKWMEIEGGECLMILALIIRSWEMRALADNRPRDDDACRLLFLVFFR